MVNIIITNIETEVDFNVEMADALEQEHTLEQAKDVKIIEAS